MKNDLLLKLSKCSGYQPRMERVKDHNGNFLAFIDDNSLRMTSYGHWTFFKLIEGLYIFNDYKYSNTTCRHQNTGRRLANSLGLSYVTFNTRDSLGYVTLDRILESKIKSLYNGENALSVSRATKYQVYSESSWNRTMNDIKLIQAAMKLSDKKLEKMMKESELKESENLLIELAEKHSREVTRREAVKSIQSLVAISL